MKNTGNILRELRENKQLPLRVIAAFLDIDPAIMSRIERGQRKASREQITKLAKYFNVDENELLVAWLSDKIVYELADEENAMKALKVAEAKVKYNKSQQIWNLNNYRPANELAKKGLKKDDLSSETLDNFEKVFKKINKLFE